MGEAADGDELAEAVPAVFVDQGLDDGFQGEAVEGVVAHSIWLRAGGSSTVTWRRGHLSLVF